MGKDRVHDIPGPISATASVIAVAAATTTVVYDIFRAPDAVKITKIEIVPQAAVTGNDSNTKYLNVLDGGAAGTGTTEVANLDLATGVNLVALDGKNIPLNATYASGCVMAEGDTLLLQIEKVGTGVALPHLHVYLEYYVL